MQMGEPAAVEEPAASLQRVPTADCDYSIPPSYPPPPPPVPASLTELPPPPPPQATESGDELEDETQVADTHLLPQVEDEDETPEIGPSATDPPPEELKFEEDGEQDKEAIQNDASFFLSKGGYIENRAIEFQREQDRNMKRDSGLASMMDSESLQQTTTTSTPGPVIATPIVLNDPAAVLQEIAPSLHTSESELEKTTHNPEIVAVATPSTPSAIVMQSVRNVSYGTADTRSIAAGSIGGRSLVAPSTISREDEVLSLKVRSLYDSGFGTIASDASSQFSDIPQRRISSIIEEGAAAGVSQIRGTRSSFPGASKEISRRSRLGGSVEDLRMLGAAEEEVVVAHEEIKRYSLAGGIEDWEDLEGFDVDRYGFINHAYISSSSQAPPGAKAAPKRVATALFLQSQQPRKRPLPLAFKTLRLSPSAPEMLKSPLPGKSIVMRDKENNRSRKWREMARRTTRSGRGTPAGKGAGVEWKFDTNDPKVISRTWKGIPDCWRGAAWHAFLTASATSRGIGKPDDELVNIYNELLERPSSDDVQIDLDVPRTISYHIMFRRRYRGGQRLLFRVLHSLALYFPDTGYVQGMASIAATLLCYYDEETAFVMMVRLWELRGLEKLYQQPGFDGLMAALDEFEIGWMKGNQISKKLTSVGIGPTAYGTRWYLTLFNYSIPFAAQLRVWDVFMLLGDPDTKISGTHFNGTLDVLHATSSAILDGCKTIILRSDFEDAMKNLTSFIPVKDEDLLMKVVRSEWRARKRRFGPIFTGRTTTTTTMPRDTCTTT